jgi:hypothetical protein
VRGWNRARFDLPPDVKGRQDVEQRQTLDAPRLVER